MVISRTHYLDHAPLTFDEDQGTNSMAGAYLRLAANCILRRFLKKNFPQLGSRSRADQNVPLGQLRVALQASFNRLHRFLAQGYPLLIHLAA